MIFQEPMTSLNPAYTVGNQIAEQVRAHRGHQSGRRLEGRRRDARPGRDPQAAARAQDYPHAFSGGMRQRVMIAMALSCSPKLLIADEPTTALDVTTQSQIIELLHTLQREEDMAMIFVTHDLGVIADVADDVVVMYAGQIVEQAAAVDLFGRPRHPYTEALLDSIPQLTPRGEPLHAIPGMVPRADQFPAGCRFAPRCSYALDACTAEPVPLREPARVDGATTGPATDKQIEGHAGSLCPPGRARPVERGRPGDQRLAQHPGRDRIGGRCRITGARGDRPRHGLPAPQRRAPSDHRGGQGG